MRTINMKNKLHQKMESLFTKLLAQIKRVYGERLLTLAVFGSWAGGRNSPESDIDLLIVAKDLSRRRLARVNEFEKIEKSLEEEFQELSREGIYSYFSPIFKTPEEIHKGSLLFLDMLYDLIILYDKDSFFSNYLKEFKERLNKLGAKRVVQGEKWYWVLKANYKPGETFKI